MNFDITGGGGLGSTLFIALLVFSAVILVVAILNGLWRTRSGAPTIDEEDGEAR